MSFSFRDMSYNCGIILAIKSPDEKTILISILWLIRTQHHMTQRCHLRLSETKSFHPNLVPFYSQWQWQTEAVTSVTVWNVCMRLCMKQFPTLGRSSTCMLQLVKWLMRCFQRAVSHWCAERSDTTEPQIWEVNGRIDEETEGRSECTPSGCRESSFFSASLLLAHRQSVWDLVWSALVRSLQSPSNAACMHTASDEERIATFYQVEQWKISLERTHIHWYTQSPPSAAAYTVCEHHSVKT